MSDTKRVIIYGDSIFLSGIAESLRADSGLKVVEIHPQGGKINLETSEPDVVVVDASRTSQDQLAVLMALFRSKPGLPFISLDADDKQLTVLSSLQYPAVSLPDLTQVIKRYFTTLPNL